jgi:hypothetical protein
MPHLTNVTCNDAQSQIRSKVLFLIACYKMEKRRLSLTRSNNARFVIILCPFNLLPFCNPRRYFLFDSIYASPLSYYYSLRFYGLLWCYQVVKGPIAQSQIWGSRSVTKVSQMRSVSYTDSFLTRKLLGQNQLVLNNTSF